MDVIESSAIDWADFRPDIHDPKVGACRIHFKGKDWAYTYHDFPAFLYKQFLETDSHGKFYHTWIKDRYMETKEDV